MIVDASMAAAWFLPDERSDETDLIFAGLGRNPGLVPTLFWFETRNLFVNAERRLRLRPGEAQLSMMQLRQAPLEDDTERLDNQVVALALTHAISGYDASYLALAMHRGRPIATLDRRLANAARSEGVALLGPLA